MNEIIVSKHALTGVVLRRVRPAPAAVQPAAHARRPTRRGAPAGATSLRASLLASYYALVLRRATLPKVLCEQCVITLTIIIIMDSILRKDLNNYPTCRPYTLTYTTHPEQQYIIMDHTNNHCVTHDISCSSRWHNHTVGAVYLYMCDVCDLSHKTCAY